MILATLSWPVSDWSCGDPRVSSSLVHLAELSGKREPEAMGFVDLKGFGVHYQRINRGWGNFLANAQRREPQGGL